MKTKVLGLLMVAAMLFTASVSAQRPQRENNVQKWDRERTERKARPGNMRSNLFTDEQKEAIKEMNSEIAVKVKPLMNELGELEAKQRSLTTGEDSDLDAIYKNIEKISDVRTEIAKLRAKHNQDVRAMLTEEQLLKFDSMKKRQPDMNRDRDFNQRNRMNRGRFDRS